MTSVRKALGLSFIERYALIVLGLLSYVVIARLLTPNEIGLYSVTAALIGIAQVVREFGIGSYLIQERDLTPEKLATAFGVSIIGGLLMFVAIMLLSPLVGNFYDDARIVPILRIVCLNFLILPFCSVALSVLRRGMDFQRLLLVNLVSGVIGFVGTVGLAVLGFGPTSLAWGTVLCNLATAVGAWAALGGSARPGRPRLVAWRSLWSYGKQSTFAAVVVSAATDVNDLVVGKALGFTPVAILNRAMGLMNLFQRDLMGAARSVAYPAFASAHRDEKGLEPVFVESFTSVTAAGWPFYGFLALFPLECLRLMAGAQWDAAVPYVYVFVAAGAIICTATLTQTLVLAMGRVDLASRADAIVSLLRLGLVTVAAIVFRDLHSVAIAVFVSFALAAPIFFAFKHRCLPNDWQGLAKGGVRSLAVTAVALALPALVSLGAGLHRSVPLSNAVFLPLCVCAFAAWVIALRVCGHPMSADPMYRRIFGRFGMAPLARSV